MRETKRTEESGEGSKINKGKRKGEKKEGEEKGAEERRGVPSGRFPEGLDD